MSLLASFARATLLYIPTGYPLLSGLLDDPVRDAMMARDAGYGSASQTPANSTNLGEERRRAG